MARKVIVAGLTGFVVLMVWTFVVNGLFGLQSRVAMKVLPEERAVYELLKEKVPAPGHYVVNPKISDGHAFPADEPAFGLSYPGFGHEAAGNLMVMETVIGLLLTTIAAALLSMTTKRVLGSFGRKVLFFTLLGVLFALVRDMGNHGIAGYPLGDALILGANRVVAWTLAGVGVAVRLKTE